MLIGDMDQATQELERAKTLEPTNRKALVNLAMVAVCQHRYEAALSLLQAPLSQDPEDQTANAIRLASLHELGRRDELEQIIRDRPNLLKDPHCLYTLAYAAFDLGRFDEAEHYLRLHNETNARLAEAWELLGRSILVPIQQLLLKTASSSNWISENLRDRIEEAIVSFSRAEQLLAHAETKHELIPVLPNRGVARTFLSLYDDARKDYERALDLDPSLDDVRRNLGNLAMVTGKPDEAVRLFEQIQSPSKKAEAAPYMAAAYLNTDKPAAAREAVSPQVNNGNSNDKPFSSPSILPFMQASCSRMIRNADDF
jgi:tetratricopeptide (TPR) repeat protein